MPAQLYIPESAKRDLRNAWVCVVVLPVSVALAILVGEALLASSGYVPGEPAIPAAVRLAVGIPMVALAGLPAVGAYRLGNRARHEGEERGFAPALTGVVLGTAFVLPNVLGMLFG